MADAPRPAKTIGILTSGGDCAGLNAAIRAVVSRAVQGYGWRVLGIHDGTMGLLRRPLDFEELDLRIATVNILRLGGTILGTTNKGNPFAFPMPDGSLKDRSAEVIDGVRELGLDAAHRHRRRRQLRHPAPPGAAGRPQSGRHPQDHRQRCRRHRDLDRLRHRGDGRDRGARPAAADRRKPRSRHDPRSDGPRRRPYRARQPASPAAPTSS